MIYGINSLEMVADTVVEHTENNGSGFEDILMNEINNVDFKLKNADQSVLELATNKNTNVHDVMLSIQDAKLSLQLFMKVRDSALESLQDILKMQV